MIGYPLPAGLFGKAGFVSGFLEDEAFGGKGGILERHLGKCYIGPTFR